MMISAMVCTSLCSLVKFMAMVAVRVASTLALTPWPRPSDRTTMSLFSSLNFSERNTSPQMRSPSWLFCWASTSMWKSLLMVALILFLLAGLIEFNDGVEHLLGIGCTFAQQIAYFLDHLQVFVNHLGDPFDHLFLAYFRCIHIAEDSSYDLSFFNGEDGQIQQFFLQVDITVDDVLLVV